MKIHEIATGKDFNIDVKRTSGEEQMVCPKCSHERKKKTLKCFSWNNEKSVGHCGHCNSSFVVNTGDFIPEKKYTIPKFNNRTDLSEKVINYFFTRGISQQTLIDFKISEGQEFMPQTGQLENTIQFNYFRNGQLVNTKFRTGRKHFKLVKDAELILYNLDAIKDAQEMIICEGEPDALSWHEAGYKAVVSVPNGASKNQKLEYIDNCYQYFENKTKIYLSTDNDEPGLLLRDELARRLGYDRCFKLDFNSHKDANDYLCAHGKEKLLETLKLAKEFPIEGVFGINDCWDQLLHIYEHGLPTGPKTGDDQFDSHLGCMPGELTTITGIPGHGKSIYLDQISLGLCLYSDWKFGACSPESHPMSFYFSRLIKRLVGTEVNKLNLSIDDLSEAKQWIEDRYHLISPEEGYSLDKILTAAKALVLRKGINGLILDPWNRIENTKPSRMSEGEWIAACLVKIISFAQKNGVHVFLVAHPTKMGKTKDELNFNVPNLYNISGSAHFFNMTQNGLTVYKNLITHMTEIHIQKVKWEHLGKTGTITYSYNTQNARFIANGQDPSINWLKSLVKDRELKETLQPDLFLDASTEDDYPF